MGRAIAEDINDCQSVAGLLEHVQSQLEAIQARLDRLESAQRAPSPAAKPETAANEAVATPPESPEKTPFKAEITEEEVLANSPALAAYLGVRVHVKQIRLVSSRAWAQEGRVSIQASHRLHS